MIYSINSRCTLIGTGIFWNGLDIRLVPVDREKFSLSNCVLSFFLKVSSNGTKFNKRKIKHEQDATVVQYFEN